MKIRDKVKFSVLSTFHTGSTYRYIDQGVDSGFNRIKTRLAGNTIFGIIKHVIKDGDNFYKDEYNNSSAMMMTNIGQHWI